MTSTVAGIAVDEGAAFVSAMEDCYGRAVARAGSEEQTDIQLGTGRIRLSRAGNTLDSALLTAFAHRIVPVSDSSDVELEIRLWDGKSTGVFAPPPPWTERDFLARGEVRHQFAEGIQLSFRIDSGVLSVFDAGRNIAYCWMRDVTLLPPWEIAAPLRPMLAWWATSTGRQLVHGAAVGTDRGAVLLSARGGSGKSTTALSALERGLVYLGDDYVLLESPSSPTVASLYCTAKLVPANLHERLPMLARFIEGQYDPSQEKVTLALNSAFGAQLRDTLHARAIVVPQVSGRDDVLFEPVSPASVLAALAPTTMLQLPGSDQTSLSRMGEFAAAIPGFRMHLSHNLDRNVEAISGLIDSLSGETA